MQIKKLTIIGTGMIGGSLALALKRRGVCATVCGYDADADSLRQALALGVIDEAAAAPAQAVADAEIAVLSAPITAAIEMLPELAPHLGAQTILSDVSSAKSALVAAARKHLRSQLANFVPAHPIAGREQSGVAAARADLFVNHTLIITPLEQTANPAKDRIREMWRQTGAEVAELSVRQHDEILAATSHLPHVLAYALVDCLAAMRDKHDVFAYAAGGFADFSRIASSNPRMWRDICVANREPLLDALEAFEHHFREIRGAISESDGDRLLEIFREAKQTRDRHTAGRDSC